MKYYRVYDIECGRYFATGYNSTSRIELVKEFQSFIKGADDVPTSHINTWAKIAEYMQYVDLEVSDTPFEDINDNDYA